MKGEQKDGFMNKQDDCCNKKCGCSGGAWLLWLIIAILLIAGGYYFATRNKTDKIEPLTPSSKIGIFAIADVSQTKKSATQATPLTQADADAMKKVIQQQLDILKSNDIDKAYTFASKDFKEYTSYDSFKRFVEAYPEFTSATSYSISDVTPEDESDMFLVTFKTPKGDSHLEYRLTKDDGEWKAWGMRFLDSAYEYPIKDADQRAFLSIIQDQLDSIHQKDVSKSYYDYTSDDFQKITSLKDFQDYLNTYPIFADNPKITVNSAQMKGKQALFNVTLNSSKDKADVDYRFIQENDDWKVWGILLLNQMSAEEAKDQQESISKLIKDQMSEIQKGDFSKAYYAYTSQGFQESSSFDDFKKFLNDHPLFSKSAEIKVNRVENGEDVTKVYVDLKNGSENELEYRLVQEQGKWKILSLQLVDRETTKEKTYAEDKSSGEMKISKALIGTKTDLNGWVTDPTDKLPAGSQKITLNLWLDNAKKGDTVTVELYHEDSKSSVTPVSTQIPETGEAVATFVFTPPTQGWPPGKYIFKVSSSTGIKTSYTLTLE